MNTKCTCQNSSILSSSVKHKYAVIQCNISTNYSSVWPIDKTLSGTTSPGQSGLSSDGNKGILHTSKSSSVTETSPSDCLVPYLQNALEGSKRFSQCILQLQTTGRHRDKSNCQYLYNTLYMNIYIYIYIYIYMREHFCCWSDERKVNIL